MATFPSARAVAIFLGVAVALAGCAGGPERRAGGYYLDDGPPEDAAIDVSAIPDPVPRAEPIRAAATRPYSALGMRFVPMTRLDPYRARGRASWYGRRYHGKATASGEPYDMLALSAAHPTLPIPSYARVTNLANARQVVVRVNDRGPFHPGRIMDLSYAAALKLDLVRAGGGDVEVELILPDSRTARQEDDPHRLQLGAYRSEGNAAEALAQMRRDMPWLADKLVVRRDAEGLYRVFASPFASRQAALQAADRIWRDLAQHALIQPEETP